MATVTLLSRTRTFTYVWERTSQSRDAAHWWLDVRIGASGVGKVMDIK